MLVTPSKPDFTTGPPSPTLGMTNVQSGYRKGFFFFVADAELKARNRARALAKEILKDPETKRRGISRPAHRQSV